MSRYLAAVAGSGAIFVLLATLALVAGAAAFFGTLPITTGSSPAPQRPPAPLVALDTFVAASLPCRIAPAILLAQQQVESGFDPVAASRAGALGIAQFEPTTFARYAYPVPPGGASPPSPFDPVDSAWAEGRMLCADGAGTDLSGALVAYNCGSTSPRCVAASSPYAAEVEHLASRMVPG